MTEEIVGSKVRADAFYGQNGSAQPSSLLPGDKIKRGAVANSIVQPVTLPAENADGATRTVSAKPIKPAFGMKDPNAGNRKVPASTGRG